MKIISIGPASPLRGGIAKFNESFVVTCNSMGYNTEIVSYFFLYPSFLFPGKSQFSTDVVPPNLKIHSVIHSLNPFNWHKVVSIISDFSPDLIVIHYWMPFFAPVLGVIARKLKKKTGVVIIAIAHNLIPHETQPGTRMLTRWFLKSIDGLVALSSSVVRDYKGFNLPGAVINLPHPVYDIYGEKSSREDSLNYLNLDNKLKYLLFFGLIRKYKGLDLLLDAFSKLNDDNMRLLVAGEFYENKEKYFKQVEKLGIREKVIFIDNFIPDNEVKYYFGAVEVVVQPYLTATQSGVTQIAYHFECPMIVTNVGGLSEIVIDGKTGFVCNKNADEIADKIRKTLVPSRRKKFIEEIRKEKDRFSWNGFVEKVLELYYSFRKK